MTSAMRGTRAARRRVAGGAVSAFAAVVVVGLASMTGAANATTSITEYGPVPSSIPIGGVCETEFDQHGKLWVEQYVSSQLARFDLEKNTFDQFNTPMPLSVPGGMAMGPDGYLWSTQVTGNSLLRINTSTGAMEEIVLPWANALNATMLDLPRHTGLTLTNDISVGVDDAMWFTLGGINAIGRIDPITREMTKYEVPGEMGGQAAALFGIIKPGPGRSIVFDMPQRNTVATIDVDTKKFTSYTMPTPASFPVGIRTDDRGVIWVSESAGMTIARINPATGAIVEYPLFGVGGLLTGLTGRSLGNPLPLPGPLAQGSDGNIYVLLSFPIATGLGNQIAQFNPVTHDVERWSTPSSFTSPCDLNPTQPGAIWFGELTTNKIGRLRFPRTAQTSSVAGEEKRERSEIARVYFVDVDAKTTGRPRSAPPTSWPRRG